MHERLAAVLLAVALVALPSAVPPADAAEVTCVASGSLQTTEGLGTVVLTHTQASFGMTSAFAVCPGYEEVSISLYGALDGACEAFAASGTLEVREVWSGVTRARRTFYVQATAGKLVFTGGVVGFGNVTVDPTRSPNSCREGTATVFATNVVVRIA